MDRDITRRDSQMGVRVFAVGLYLLSLLSPVLLAPFLWLLIRELKGFLHHRHLPIRLIQAYLSYLLIAPYLALGHEPLILLWLVITGSHYAVPGVGKLTLGERPWDWALKNRSHYLFLAAYTWGWLAFLRVTLVERLARIVRQFAIPLQLTAIAIELGGFCLLVTDRLTVWALFGFILLHTVVFLMSGILFWEWTMVNLGLLLTCLNTDLVDLYSPTNQLLYLLILSHVPLTRIWTPAPLSWWDSPLVGRVLWEVEGRSGRRYMLYNNFMCPWERLFGRGYGFFLLDEPVLVDHGEPSHLGHVFTLEARDRLVVSGGERNAILSVCEKEGRNFYCPSKIENHVKFLQAFCEALNRGDKKRTVPSWLKAPGGQFYYWGNLPAYKRQEPVVKVLCRYREVFIDGCVIKELRNQLLCEVDVSTK